MYISSTRSIVQKRVRTGHVPVSGSDNYSQRPLVELALELEARLHDAYCNKLEPKLINLLFHFCLLFIAMCCIIAMVR